MEYDTEVTTITDILETLDKFDNKEEIINAIKQSLYDIETDYHTEELFRQELDKYKTKEKLIKNHCLTQKSIIKQQPSPDKDADMYFIARLDTILDILDRND